MATILGMKAIQIHDKYLGLPTIIGRSKKAVFTQLIVRKKVKMWKSEILSNAAKEVLIKSIAQAQSTYAMFVFLIPQGVIHEIQSIRWRIGSGDQVRVWWDRWVPNSPNFKIESPVASLALKAKVSHLIDQSERCWKSNVLQSNFDPKDRERIVKIPLPRRYQSDTQVWGRDKLGKYSVKSGYHEWRKRWNADEGERDIPVDWKRMWHLYLPPKVRVFLWRWGSNILPTRANLMKRIRDESDECPFCGLQEMQEHILRDCDWAGWIWRPSALGKFFVEGEEKSSEEWLCELIEKVSDEELCAVVMALWFLWKERINHMFNNKKLEEVITRLHAYLEEFRSCSQGNPDANAQAGSQNGRNQTRGS
ncbi:unnamed protein product [Linum trigynum]|uniref:Reverse transcriptase zinc-binding domain-containing protein n=1 Tax=Linum trigynum TaxID=586398 RepID=A0AAV2DY46_9ROSI